MAASLLAEGLHARRCRRLAPLAFGPAGGARAWTRGVPLLRALAMGAASWGFLQLAMLPGIPPGQGPGAPDPQARHLLLLLDVSPSMQLADAGPEGGQTRMHRAAQLLLPALERLPLGRVRISVVALYNGAKPVVIDTRDLEIVRNILHDLPLDAAFDPGKTRLFDGLREAALQARAWKEASTTLLVVTDGDTVPDTGIPALPRSVDGVWVVGVGDPRGGRFIDGHQSRQESSTLRQLAMRLGGTYHDGNEHDLPAGAIRAFEGTGVPPGAPSGGTRELALAAVIIGAATLAGLPLALALSGTRWQPDPVRSRTGGHSRSPGPVRGFEPRHQVTLPPAGSRWRG
ncbi:MAG TPA: hypothetical protein DCM86_04010, partial [Verrucomicrobiales bacterium]|nr:hypothetical protein [Verrucomicrobiales bacterium]